MKTISELLCANFQLFSEPVYKSVDSAVIWQKIQWFSFQTTELLNSSSTLHHKNIFSRVP